MKTKDTEVLGRHKVNHARSMSVARYHTNWQNGVITAALLSLLHHVRKKGPILFWP